MPRVWAAPQPRCLAAAFNIGDRLRDVAITPNLDGQAIAQLIQRPQLFVEVNLLPWPRSRLACWTSRRCTTLWTRFDQLGTIAFRDPETSDAEQERAALATVPPWPSKSRAFAGRVLGWPPAPPSLASVGGRALRRRASRAATGRKGVVAYAKGGPALDDQEHRPGELHSTRPVLVRPRADRPRRGVRWWQGSSVPCGRGRWR
jgi:hypothetical protein